MEPGCHYKSKTRNSLTNHRAVVHDIDVTWYPCTEDQCQFRSKTANELRKHKSNVHNIGKIQWLNCMEEGCTFKSKSQVTVDKHRRNKHPDAPAPTYVMGNTYGAMVNTYCGHGTLNINTDADAIMRAAASSLATVAEGAVMRGAVPSGTRVDERGRIIT